MSEIVQSNLRVHSVCLNLGRNLLNKAKSSNIKENALYDSDQQKTIFSLYTSGVLMPLKVYSAILVMKGQFLLWHF